MLQSGSQVTEGTHFRNYRRSTMNAACPSCRSDDQPGEDPSPTQGVCSRHQEQLLESLPSVSFPEVEFLMVRSEEHTSELQSHSELVCRLLLEKKKLR